MSITEINLRLIQEMKKQGREILWQLNHPLYKNNTLRHVKWLEIGDALGISSLECMSMWKGIKSKNARAKINLKNDSYVVPSGSYVQTQKYTKLKEFVNQMSYFESDNHDSVTENVLPQVLPLPSPTSPISRVLTLKDGSEVLIQSRKNRLILPKPTLTVTSKARPQKSEESPEPVIKKIKSQPVPETPKPSTYCDRTVQNVDEETAYEQFGKYVAAELRHLPPREAILLQQELLNSITRVKLSCLDSSYSHGPELLHVDVASHNENSSTSSNSPIDSKSDDFDVLGQAMITTFGANGH